jgi:hypothetical protein
MLNIRMSKTKQPVQLYGPGKTAAESGLMDDDLLDFNERNNK